MSHFEIRREHGHLWLFWRGVVIWSLSRDGSYSHLHQVAPSTCERLPEAPRHPCQ